jgi:putative copper resistance protein D
MAAVFVPPGTEHWMWLAQWRPDPWAVVPMLLAGWIYLAGARRLARGNSPWPLARTAWFFAGLAALSLALVSPIDAFADASFSIHMVQHLALTLLAPPLIALGAPITLALRAASPEVRRRFLVPALHSRFATLLAKPVVGWLLFVCVPVAIHVTPVFDLALRNNFVHAVEHLVWVSSALIYWWPIVGRDPSPRSMSYPARLLSLFLAMPAASFLALALYSARAPLYPSYAALPPPWGSHALADQQAAAVTMWLVGNLALVLAMLIVAAAWKRHDDARQLRVEARLDAQAVESAYADPNSSPSAHRSR